MTEYVRGAPPQLGPRTLGRLSHVASELATWPGDPEAVELPEPLPADVCQLCQDHLEGRPDDSLCPLCRDLLAGPDPDAWRDHGGRTCRRCGHRSVELEICPCGGRIH